MGLLERAKSVPEGLLDAAWTLLSSWRPLGALLEASWSALGGFQGRKNKVGIGSWPLHKAFGDWFQLSWGPKGRPGGVKNVPKSNPIGDPSWNVQNPEI